jgi:hypothetical protein
MKDWERNNRMKKCSLGVVAWMSWKHLGGDVHGFKTNQWLAVQAL